MKRHLQAVEATLPEAWPVHLFTYTGAVTPPYVVLEAPGWGTPDERPACDETQALSTLMRVKVVARDATQADAMLRIARDRLSPDGATTRVPMDDRALDVRFLRGEFIDADRSITVQGTNLNPVVGVDSYSMHSVPLPEPAP